MKSIFRVFSLFIICASSAVLSGAVEAKTMVTEMQGDCQVMRENAAMVGTKGFEAKPGDKIMTGPDGRLDMTWNKMAGCRMLPSSQVSLTEFNPAKMHLNVEKGNVILNLNKLPKDTTFEVETPTAVAAVRGTQFWGRVESTKPENPVTTFAVRQGVVEILDKASSKSFKINQGEALDISKESTAAPSVRKALPEEMQAMEQADAIQIS